MTQQTETTLKMRYWGENVDHPADVHNSWVQQELTGLGDKVADGMVEGSLSGPMGERGYWEVETKRTDSEDLDAAIPGLALDQIQWRQEGLAPAEPASALRAQIQIGSYRMHLYAVAVTEGDDGSWEAVDPAYADDLEGIERINDAKSATTTIDGRDYVLWSVPHEI